MNPSGLHVNKTALIAAVVGIAVLGYVWYRYSSPVSTATLSMDPLAEAKAAVDKVKVHHDTKLTFKVGDKDVTIAYREVKPESPKLDVLFLHGMSFKSETWVSEPVKTLQLLYNLNYRAVAIDLPGFGDSPKAEVDHVEFMGAVITKLNLQKPVIVSPSMSGSYALPYLLSAPSSSTDKCRGYVPVAPVHTEKFEAKEYKKLQVPTLIIYGSKDKSVGQISRDNLKNIPKKTVVELADAGHACYMNKPDEFHKHLYAFLLTLTSS